MKGKEQGTRLSGRRRLRWRLTLAGLLLLARWLSSFLETLKLFNHCNCAVSLTSFCSLDFSLNILFILFVLLWLDVYLLRCVSLLSLWVWCFVTFLWPATKFCLYVNASKPDFIISSPFYFIDHLLVLLSTILFDFNVYFVYHLYFDLLMLISVTILISYY